jgi:hypothetical protein
MCTPLACPTTCLSRQPGWVPGGGNDAGWFPCSLRIDRSAWHPALPRQHRHGYAAGLHRGLPAGTPSRLRSRPPASGGRALHPGPYPPDLSRCHAYGALTLVPLVYRLISLAGPGPSGSTRPSRLCQRCFPPSPASPGSDCAQFPPGCCDSPARRSRTSFDSQRLTAHQRLVVHHQELGILGHLTPGQHHQTAEQTANEQVDDREAHSVMIPTWLPAQARSSNRAPQVRFSQGVEPGATEPASVDLSRPDARINHQPGLTPEIMIGRGPSERLRLVPMDAV